MKVKSQLSPSYMFCLADLKLIHINNKSVIVEHKDKKYFLHVRLYNQLLSGNILVLTPYILESKGDQDIIWLMIVKPSFY